MPRTQDGRRLAFVKNEDLSLPGFQDERTASLAAEMIPKASDRRIKVAYRSRTETYDVVVRELREIDS